jgi:hypothetical protein
MHENVRLSLCFLRIIRWWLVIKAVHVVDPFSTRVANWIGERSGLNDALRAVLAESDRREARAEPLSALQAKS